MKVHQLQAGQGIGLAQLVHHRQDLAGGEAELGLLPAGVLPAATAHGGQAGAQADPRPDADALGLLQDQRQLGELLHHQVDPVAELLAHQCQAHVLAILVPVADDQRGAVPGEGQHGEQLRLAAGLQADAAAATLLGGEDLLDHPALLVDLDRVDGGVAAAEGLLLHGGIEGGAQLLDPVVEDVGEAHQHRQAQAGALELGDQLVQRQGRALGLAAQGAHQGMPRVVHVVVAAAPLVDIPDAACALRRAAGTGHGETHAFTSGRGSAPCSRRASRMERNCSGSWGVRSWAGGST